MSDAPALRPVVVLTRPSMLPLMQALASTSHAPGVASARQQEFGLRAALSARGIDTVEFPLIDILPPDDPLALDRALDDLASYALAVFVSPAAIDAALGRLSEGPGAARTVPVELPIAVLGPGSVAALARFGVSPATHRILAPVGALPAPGGENLTPENSQVSAAIEAAGLRFDSEALLAAMSADRWLERLRGARVLLVRGNGGRELLGEALASAGAQVDAVSAYRRAVPAPSAAQWQALKTLMHERRHAWVLTSSEGIRNLTALAAAHLDGPAQDLLRRATTIVPHPRIAESARKAGFDSITFCDAGDAGILRALLAAFDENHDGVSGRFRSSPNTSNEA
ncbi:MAG: uroporphyrinogen-III synthase [Janthinobacterium lividum]